MRLELSTRSDIAIRAIRALPADAYLPRAALADATGTSPPFLARVMGTLVAHGWVDSRPGVAGGYRLAVDPCEISVLALIDAVEGVPTEDRCVLRGGPCGSTATCALHVAWMGARGALLAELASTSVADC